MAEQFLEGGMRVDTSAAEEVLVKAKEALDQHAAAKAIMTSDDLVQLAQFQVGLERRAGQLEVKMATEPNARNLAAGRAEKRVAYALMELTKNRIKFLKDTNARLNHNFRKLAKERLSADLYSQIEQEARLPLKK